MRHPILTSVAVAASTLAFSAGQVDARHVPSVSADCDGLHINLVFYQGPDGNNSITTTVDQTVTVETFGSSYHTDIAWPDTGPHEWSATVDANINFGPSDQYDISFEGTQAACQPTTTTTTSTLPDTTTLAPSTTAPCTDNGTNLCDTSTSSPQTTDPCAVDGTNLCDTSTSSPQTTICPPNSGAECDTTPPPTFCPADAEAGECDPSPQDPCTDSTGEPCPEPPCTQADGSPCVTTTTLVSTDTAPTTTVAQVLPRTGSKGVAVSISIGLLAVIVGAAVLVAVRRNPHS